MARNARINDQFVIPGQKLCVIEEFIPGDGTFEDDGNIYSKTIGTTRFDFINKVVTVQRKTKKPVVPEENATVMAMVTRSQKKIAQLEILSIDEKPLDIPFTGILHISSSSPSYQHSMKDVVKAGDIVRARIINAKSVLPQLTTIGRDLGAIKAFCSRCGQALILKNGELRCAACGNTEIRKTAQDYRNDLT